MSCRPSLVETLAYVAIRIIAFLRQKRTLLVTVHTGAEPHAK
jgi:hypothetical protein